MHARSEEINLEVVHSRPAWRPLFLTARRFIRICRMIERGQSASEACRRELVTYRLFRMHVSRNPKYERRLKQAEELREHFLYEYHMANLTRHSKTSVSASMFFLERRHPDRWALRVVNRQINSTELVLDRVSPEQLVEDIRLAQQVAGERVQLPSSPQLGEPQD
jgi:hypothetical protein